MLTFELKTLFIYKHSSLFKEKGFVRLRPENTRLRPRRSRTPPTLRRGRCRTPTPELKKANENMTSVANVIKLFTAVSYDLSS
jgi:hypothetical protein